MTHEQAQWIAERRLRDDMTWRELATAVYEKFGYEILSDAFSDGWGGNQLAGMALCQRASDLLGDKELASGWVE